MPVLCVLYLLCVLYMSCLCACVLCVLFVVFAGVCVVGSMHMCDEFMRFLDAVFKCVVLICVCCWCLV